MLDTATKRRIDSARDILVGKVPDPKSQVEQITIALIYKFMDDMDAESEELGGKRKFFEGDFARYGWAKLLRGGLGGHEMLGVYAEAITRMTENPAIPPLFRDIFKNAYLPYRDPETLRAFLRIIDEFTYDHSERLGDAFEYLLSVLGSQGDAGQFRTPRHIIDFMVAVLDPKKDETILDPACGTAGFLISSYKHILAANMNAAGHSTLTPDERGRMAKNLKGYDISPDMVRLSLVNLYLHGFTDPHIDEYDTLTSEEKWNEYADVILANPPFMSPKGGIKPHRRFSVQSKRSEVLFVDYMAEHLTPKGRAGIIVPEGIIFQSQGAYTELRRMLVEGYLVAVVSLPAGVFNPYSGVKTSILILDKALAKGSGTVGFFKIEADGYGLGAQRRAVEQNDLPAVQAEIAEYLERLRSSAALDDFAPAHGMIVAKEKIAAGGDYNLSGERYREGAISTQSWPMVALSEFIDELESGVSVNSTNRPTIPGEVGILKTSCVTLGVFKSEEHKAVLPDEVTRVKCPVRKGSIIISRMNTEALVGANAYVDKDYENLFLPDRLWQTVISREDVLAQYVQHVLSSPKYRNRISSICSGTSGSMKNIAKSQLLALQIPLPPLSIQQEIVAEIEGYQKVIDGARAVVEAYKPQIPVHPDWPMVELGNLCEVKSGGTPSRSEESYWNGHIPWVSTTLINYGMINQANEFITKEGLENSSAWVVPKGTVLMAMYGQGVTRGRVAILGIDAAVNQACAAFMIKNRSLSPEFLFLILQSQYEHLRLISEARGGNQSNLSAQVLKEVKIPLPPLPTQQSIVAEIEAEQALVAANRELITRFEAKIAAALARVWGGEGGAPAQPAGGAVRASGAREAWSITSGPGSVAAEPELAYATKQ